MKAGTAPSTPSWQSQDVRVPGRWERSRQPLMVGVPRRERMVVQEGCDAVCSTHSGPGEFYPSCWINRHGVPRYYPGLATLTGMEGIPAQTEALATLLQQAPHGDRSVKDSFNCIDLQTFGFTPLFSAEWLWATALGTVGHVSAEPLVQTRNPVCPWSCRWRACRRWHTGCRGRRNWHVQPLRVPGCCRGRFARLGRVRRCGLPRIAARRLRDHRTLENLGPARRQAVGP